MILFSLKIHKSKAVLFKAILLAMKCLFALYKYDGKPKMMLCRSFFTNLG